MAEHAARGDAPIIISPNSYENSAETPIVIRPDSDETEKNAEADDSFKILEALAKGEITDRQTIKEKSLISRESEILKAKIEFQGTTCDAILKRQSGQVGVNFLGGTISGESVPQREFAAYMVVNALDLEYVPITALRKDGDDLTSAQQFIPDAVPGNKSSWDEDKGYSVPIDPYAEWNIPEEQFVEVAALSYLLGQVDGHLGNVIKGSNGNMYMIDNALTFPDKSEGFYNNASLIRKFAGKTIPDRLQTALQTLMDVQGNITEAGSALVEKLQPLISPAESAAFVERLALLLKQKTVPSPDR